MNRRKFLKTSLAWRTHLSRLRVESASYINLKRKGNPK
jgi:hypothetical protein